MASSKLSRPSGGFAFPNDKLTLGYISRGAPEIQFMDSVLGMFEYDRYLGPGRFHEHQWRIGLRGHVNVSRGRCKMVRQFLEGKGDWLLMADDDMSWGPEAHEQLLAAVAAVSATSDGALEPWQVVVGGLTFGWLPEGTGIAPVMFGRESDGRFTRMDEPLGQGIRQVAGTGAAFLLVNRRVFVEIEKRMLDIGAATQAPWFREHEQPIVDEWDEDGNPTHATTYWVSEDLWFCDMATHVGCRIFVAQNVEVGHKKHVILSRSLYERGQLSIA